jgi:hypothetical protein
MAKAKVAKSDADRIKQLEDALTTARTGLFQIIDLDPVTMIGQPGSPRGLGIVKAFEKAQQIAEKIVLTMSDKEQDKEQVSA